MRFINKHYEYSSKLYLYGLHPNACLSLLAHKVFGEAMGTAKS